MLLCALCVITGMSGCAALTNPVARGIPAHHLAPELRGQSREGKEPLPLNLLRQPPPENYLLAAEDVLGVWIEGVFGEKGQAPPTHYSDKTEAAPSLGYPIAVRKDGTIPLPLIGSLKVEGMTVEQVEDAIRKNYTVDRKLLVPGARIIVTLIKPRAYRVLVIREDSSNAGGAGGTATSFGGGLGLVGFQGGELVEVPRRGTGYALELPAYQNDVLNALAKTGGLPGTDALDEVIIQRNYFKTAEEQRKYWEQVERNPTQWKGIPAGKFVRIPLRMRPGDPIPFRPQDVVLENGDIVFIERRELDIFYCGGLLPSGEHVLPRDRDIDVVQAVSRLRGPLINGGVAASSLSGAFIAPGLGNPNPTLLSVIRKTPGGGEVVIRVDLNRALRDPAERILVQAGDMLILQETPGQAFARYMSQVFNFTLLYTPIHSAQATGAGIISVPSGGTTTGGVGSVSGVGTTIP
jgi:protein involved in polysaccharide export with SLBB domain